MAKWTTIARRDVTPSDTYQAPRTATGGVHSVKLTPTGYPLWLCDAELDDGATISWAGRHSDDVLYVMDGELDVGGGRSCPTGGAVVVESDVSATVTARGATRLAHFGSVDPEPPTSGPLGGPVADGHDVRVYGPGGSYVSGEQENVHAVWFSDGTIDTCRAQFFEVTAPPRTDDEDKPHSHSADEIIYLLDGSVSMGAYSIEPYTAISIPADVRYALRGGAAGHRFLNFRRDVSEQIYALGSEPLLETALARGGRATGDVR